jgi:hypothetical protein
MQNEGSPLPKLEDIYFQHNHENTSTYNIVLHAEETMLERGDNLDVLNVHVVGYLLIALYDRRNILGDMAFKKVSIDVCSCLSELKMAELGKWYREILLCGCTFRALSALCNLHFLSSQACSPEKQGLSTTHSIRASHMSFLFYP